MQSDPPPAAQLPTPEVHVDLGGLADAIWQSLLGHLGELGTTIWEDLTHWLWTLVRELMVAMWNATLLPVPHETTDRFATVIALMPDPRQVGAAALVLALALMGLQTILQALPVGHQAAMQYLTGRFLLWSYVLSILAWLIGEAIDLERTLAASVAHEDLSTLLPRDAAPNPVAILVMCIFGIRLWLKLASNVVHIATAVVWAPVGAACGLIPALGHIAALWAHEFFGRLAGVLLATVASGIGVALAMSNTGGSIFAVFGTAGAFIAAADMVDWFARPGTGMAGLTGQIIRTAVMLPLALGAGAAGAPPSIGGAGTTALAVREGGGAMTRYGAD